MNVSKQVFEQAAYIISRGGIVAYPTESCFGLGCDLNNELAVKRLLRLKNRSISKGLIIIAYDFEQLKPWIDSKDINEQELLKVWPGAFTWLIKKSVLTPKWISGNSDKVAVRVPGHKVARDLCYYAKMALVSTSCNIAGQPAAKSVKDVKAYFYDDIDFIVEASIGDYQNPSTICDFENRSIIRN